MLCARCGCVMLPVWWISNVACAVWTCGYVMLRAWCGYVNVSIVFICCGYLNDTQQ